MRGDGFIKGSLNLSAGTHNKSDTKCPICGKMFRAPLENVFWYREGGRKIDVCGYTCHGIALALGKKKRKKRP